MALCGSQTHAMLQLMGQLSFSLSDTLGRELVEISYVVKYLFSITTYLKLLTNFQYMYIIQADNNIQQNKDTHTNTRHAKLTNQ